MSLDGYVSDPAGSFDWAVPSDEAHEFINDRMRSVGTHLMGRRMYQTMVYWETAHLLPDPPPFVLEFARIWQAAHKVVFSTTLERVASERTKIRRTFDPGLVQEMKAASELDLSVGGSDLAGQAILAGLVHEYEVFLVPVLVGGGQRSLPDGVRSDSLYSTSGGSPDGMVHLRYGVIT